MYNHDITRANRNGQLRLAEANLLARSTAEPQAGDITLRSCAAGGDTAVTASIGKATRTKSVVAAFVLQTERPLCISCVRQPCLIWPSDLPRKDRTASTSARSTPRQRAPALNAPMHAKLHPRFLVARYSRTVALSRRNSPHARRQGALCRRRPTPHSPASSGLLLEQAIPSSSTPRDWAPPTATAAALRLGRVPGRTMLLVARPDR